MNGREVDLSKLRWLGGRGPVLNHFQSKGGGMSKGLFLAGWVLAVGSLAGCGVDGAADEELAQLQLGLVASLADFSGNSVRVVGARSPAADAKYDCANSIDACLPFNADGTTPVLLGLCASENTPTGTWSFSYQVFASTDCTGSELTNFECPGTPPEPLPAGVITVNQVQCTSLNAGKTFDFDSTGINPPCPVGQTCTTLAGLTPSFSGRAIAFQSVITPPLLPPVTTTINDTGALPSSGGSITSNAGVGIPGLVTFSAASAHTEGGLPATPLLAESDSNLTNVSVEVPGVTISATVSSQTTASCLPTAATATSVVTNLVINGIPTPVTGAVNETITLVGLGTLVLNEQIPPVSVGPLTATANVTALHLTLLSGAADVKLAQSHSDITCGP